jgi:hypothetical protein
VFVAFRLLLKNVWVAVMTMFLSIKLVTKKLQSYRSAIILLSAIKQMIFALKNFFSILTITYFTVGTAKFLVLPHSHGWKNSIVNEFWASVTGGEKTETTEDLSERTTIFLIGVDVVVAVVVGMVLMNTITTMLTDLYSKEKDKAEVSQRIIQSLLFMHFHECS